MVMATATATAAAAEAGWTYGADRCHAGPDTAQMPDVS